MVQLRDDAGGIREVPTVKQAFEEAAKDLSIWKISWSEGAHRIRLVRVSDAWKYEPLYVPTEV